MWEQNSYVTMFQKQLIRENEQPHTKMKTTIFLILFLIQYVFYHGQLLFRKSSDQAHNLMIALNVTTHTPDTAHTHLHLHIHLHTPQLFTPTHITPYLTSTYTPTQTPIRIQSFCRCHFISTFFSHKIMHFSLPGVAKITYMI